MTDENSERPRLFFFFSFGFVFFNYKDLLKGESGNFGDFEFFFVFFLLFFYLLGGSASPPLASS